MPSKDSKYQDDKVFFRNFESMLHLPFVMYADFESILVKQYNVDGAANKSWNNKTQHHVADGFAVYTKSIDLTFTKTRICTLVEILLNASSTKSSIKRKRFDKYMKIHFRFLF